MAMKIRLTRMGSKKRPFYRVVACDSANRRDGRVLEYLGHYNPMVDPAAIELKMERIQSWINQGAQPTDTVRALLRKAGL